MINIYTKGVNAQLSDDFYSTQFDCHCNYPECKTTLVDSEQVIGLQHLINRYHIININSGFRCMAHNAEVGGQPASYHLRGMATDIHTPFALSEDLANSLEEIECFSHGGIGIYPSFCHADNRGIKARWRG